MERTENGSRGKEHGKREPNYIAQFFSALKVQEIHKTDL
jgi:hypothetical protein